MDVFLALLFILRVVRLYHLAVAASRNQHVPSSPYSSTGFDNMYSASGSEQGQVSSPSTNGHSDIVTILLIGLTQAGKSTFVNWLRHLSQSQSDEALEGNGSSSCTKKCGIWEIKILLSDYKLVDRSSGKDIQLPDKERDLLKEKGKWTDANSRLIPWAPDARLVTFRIVDTPGLDDGDQNDMNNITEVLGTMNGWLHNNDNPTVNGLIFLISSTSAFGDTFQGLFKYYQRCMPDLFGGLAMVNTKFSIKEWKAKRRDLEDDGAIEHSESARTRIVQQRRSDFADVFSDVLLGGDPPHWFLDSKPDPSDNLEILFSLNSTIDVLRVMAAQKPYNISHMSYVKMAGDVAVDTRIKGLVESKMHTWLKFRELIMDKSSAEKREYITNQERLLEYKQKIIDLDTELKRVNHDGEVTIRMGNTPLSDDVGFLTKVGRMAKWGGVTKTMEVDEKYEYYEVEFLDHDSAKWLKRGKNPKTSGYIGTYKASWGKFPILYTRSYTRSSVMHLEDIKRWRKQQIEAEISRDFLEQKMSDSKKLPEVDEDLERLLILISQCRDVIAKLDLEKIPVEALDEAARRRYKKDSININDYDVMDAVRTYQPSLADSWHRL
jgi:GTPase SAR1 family protein